LLAELRAALEAADLSSLASSYSGSTQGPEGQVIEIVTYTVTASDVTVSADSSADVPDSLERLNDVLGRAEGAVIENG
jgi:hypothetical protein